MRPEHLSHGNRMEEICATNQKRDSRVPNDPRRSPADRDLNGSSSGVFMQLRGHLLETAQLIHEGDWERARLFLELLSRRVSKTGDSSERLASCFFEALAVRFSRISSSTTVEFSPPLSEEPTSDETLSAYLALNQVTPFMRFAHLTANQALLEALTGEDFMHIVDLEVGHGVQWAPFLQALADLRCGEQGCAIKRVRITGIGNDIHTLETTGTRLTEFAHSIHLPFEFISLVQTPENLTPHMLHFQEGEAVAVNCMLQLHSVLTRGPEMLTNFLFMLECLNPKVVTLAEMEASHNSPYFLDRFTQALDHYSTLFDSLYATLPPSSAERARVEQAWYGMEIRNIVAYEGAERFVRHQRFELWRRFFEGNGFQLLAPSRFALAQARMLLRLHYPCDGYQLVEGGGCVLLGWQGRPLFCISSWQMSNMGGALSI